MASDAAEFADGTLSVLGDAIFNDARAVRAIMRQVESQRLGQARSSQTGVGEERAVYRVGRCGTSAFARGGRRVTFRPKGAETFLANSDARDLHQKGLG
jgi:hypothetical protein